MPEAKTYTGSCHCGKVRYEVTTDLASVLACNCSMCGRKGTWLTFVEPSQFKLLDGEGLTDYQFNRHVIHHLFCPVCGVTSYCTGNKPDGSSMVAVNVRCLEDLDLDSVKVTNYNGKSR